VPPMPRLDAETRDPVNVEAVLPTVRHPRLELALEVGLHLQKLEAKHLRVNRDRVIASTGGLASSTSSSAFAACSTMVWTARSRISRSRRAIPDARRAIRRMAYAE